LPDFLDRGFARFPADLSLPDEVSRVAAFTTTTKIDVLVNNAGFGTYGNFAGQDASLEHAEVMVNAVAGVDLAHAVLPGMLTRRFGGIITVASAIAFQPSPTQAIYGATKAFSLAFSEALWAETRGSGVRVLALCPGAIATGYLASLGDQAATSSIYRRTADPADIVRAGLSGFDHDAMTVVPGLRTRSSLKATGSSPARSSSGCQPSCSHPARQQAAADRRRQPQRRHADANGVIARPGRPLVVGPARQLEPQRRIVHDSCHHG
jgi:short-subunit dehydrogenase